MPQVGVLAEVDMLYITTQKFITTIKLPLAYASFNSFTVRAGSVGFHRRHAC